ncbi:MAG: hypothetical protein GWO12_16830 [Gemmatimonadetes bacterium]|uniref:Uncharacterized protein n=1 Tax=Candidatus Kutchimonas denitrificans TaxID=3056748 RepID=A0AAE5CD02_9BACT|nr:hypothetical protein [Candidatus Kutchimonas denitrificans]
MARVSIRQIDLTLPVPPSPNEWPKHPMQLARKKNHYRRQVWIEAIQQHKPWMEPPHKVVASATFYVWNKRDEDNLTASLKWTLDALKRDQTGKMHWREGVADMKGYIIDDDPEHLTVVKPSQEIDREDPRLVLILRWNEEKRAA